MHIERFWPHETRTKDIKTYFLNVLCEKVSLLFFGGGPCMANAHGLVDHFVFVYLFFMTHLGPVNLANQNYVYIYIYIYIYNFPYIYML